MASRAGLKRNAAVMLERLLRFGLQFVVQIKCQHFHLYVSAPNTFEDNSTFMH